MFLGTNASLAPFDAQDHGLDLPSHSLLFCKCCLLSASRQAYWCYEPGGTVKGNCVLNDIDRLQRFKRIMRNCCRRDGSK